MKSILGVIVLCLLAAVAAGAGKLRITDGTGSDSGTVGRQAFLLASTNGWELSVHKLDARAALDKLAAGETDIVLLRLEDLPRKIDGTSVIYGYYAIAVYVNAENPVREATREQIKRMLTASRPRWSMFSAGSDADIHRFAARSGGTIIGKNLLNLFAAADDILPLGSTREAVLLVEADPTALAVGEFMQEAPISVVPLRIDGIAPSRRSIRDGGYPLAVGFVAVSSGHSEEAERLLRELGTADFKRMSEEDGLLPPEAVQLKYGERKK